jgi:hypothetical protein
MLEKIDYRRLNSRQKENYNFQKASGILADYGFTTIRLSDDWNGADFIAQHAKGKPVLRVQLKGRLDVRKKYEGKKLWLCFPAGDGWYLCPHDRVLGFLKKSTKIRRSESWRKRGGYSWPRLPTHLKDFLKRFLLTDEKTS